jgi:hypothetical protein
MRLLLDSALILTLALATAGPAWSDDPEVCQYVVVIDEAQNGLCILNVGEQEGVGGVSLDWGDAGEYQAGGVDFTTVPGSSERITFVAQGPFVRVVDLTRPSPFINLDLDSQFGLTGIGLKRLDAAEPVSIGGVLRYPLYAAGSLAGLPWIVVLDQEALLERSTVSQALLFAGPLDPNGDEYAGVGLDVAAGGPPAGEGVQEAYVSVLEKPDQEQWLKIYRLVLHEDFSLDVSLDPWNDEGVPYDGSAPRANGLRYDRTGTRPFGVFQTTSVVKDLSNGESSCALSGHPNDVAVWGPDSGMESPEYLFVTSVTPLGSDLILGFPAGGCPDGGADTLSFPVSGFPRALALSSTTSSTPWIYTAHRFGQIGALNLALSSDSEGDRIEVLESFFLPVNGGPADVAIRDEAHQVCLEIYEWAWESDPRLPKVDCDEDPDDPRCKKYVLAAPGSGDDGF